MLTCNLDLEKCLCIDSVLALIYNVFLLFILFSDVNIFLNTDVD